MISRKHPVLTFFRFEITTFGFAAFTKGVVDYERTHDVSI